MVERSARATKARKRGLVLSRVCPRKTGASAQPLRAGLRLPCRDRVHARRRRMPLYLNPKRAPDLADDRLRLLRLSRKWALSGAFSRNTSKQAAKALDAAERLDAAALATRWAATRRTPTRGSGA